MIKEKAARLFRRIKRNMRSILLLWLPAGIIAAFLAVLLISVALSKDASFYSCTRLLSRCAGEKPSVGRTAKCAYQVAWCDITVLWDKLNGKKFPDLPGLPVVDEKADKELFEKLTSDEFLEQRFQELEKQEKDESKTDVIPKEDLKKYMEHLRHERLLFEKEQAEKRKTLAVEKENESGNDNLTGKTAE